MTSLDQRLSRPARLALVCVVCVLPLRYILNRFSPETYFTSLIYYGEYFFPNAIPEVRQIKPKISSFAGYDGQFYSQIAIHPSLRTPGLKESLDAPAYRAMRPFLPWLSYLAGFGRPFWIVQAYALSNLLFWYLLVFWLLHYLRPTSRRDYLCILAACTSSGVLFSLQRALRGPSCGYTLLLWGVADRKICSGRDCRSSPNERDVRVATGRKTFPQRKDREYRCSNDQVRMYFSSSATVAWICALHLWTNSLRSKLRLAIFRISCGYTQSNKNVAL